MITEDYVSFETAKLLKEKGFVQECDYATSWYASKYYKNSCQGEWFEGEHQIIEDIDDKYNISYLSEIGVFIPAPTLQMTMKWLREVHNIDIDINSECGMLGIKRYVPVIHTHKRMEKLHDTDEKVRWLQKTIYLRYEDDIRNVVKEVADFDSYEQSCEAAIKYCLENLI